MAEVRINVKTVDESTQQIKKVDQGFKGMLSTIAKVTAAAAIVGTTMKKAFDLGKEGAMLQYTADKFDNLAKSIGTTSDALLKDLRKATGGIVDDMTLVGSAGDFMALGLAKSHEEVVRLTKVAGALNMDMNQLTLTLTNQTTARFDALGVSVDGFDEKVKALEATGMSANDAFNEAFLQQAEEQIALVGDAADSAIADFLGFEAATKNLSNSFKMMLAPSMKEVASGLTDLINQMSGVTKATFEDNNKQLLINTKSNKEYREAIISAAIASGFMTEEMGNLLRAGNKVPTSGWAANLGLLEDSTYKYQRSVAILEMSLVSAADEAAAMRDVQEGGRKETEKAILAVDKYGDFLGYYVKDVESANEARKNAIISLAEEKEAYDRVTESISGPLASANRNYAEVLEDTTKKNKELSEEIQNLIDNGYSPTSKAVMDLVGEMDANKAAQDAARESIKQTTTALLFEKAAALLTSEQALELSRKLGLIDEATYDTLTAVDATIAVFDADRDSMLDAGMAASDLLLAMEAINRLQMQDKEVTFTTIWREVNAPYSGESGGYGNGASGYGVPDDDDTTTGNALGGYIPSGSKRIVGESGPEMFVPDVGGMMYPSNMSGGRMQIEIPLYIDGNEVGRASVDGTLEELRNRGLTVSRMN